MRTISPAQKQALEDLSAEGLLRGLPTQTAEKDIHITELLKSLSEMQVHHDHFGDLDVRNGEVTRRDAGIQLVFAGGTCLSKAHGLIHRMSEDIDIKVLLAPTEKPLKKGRGDRVRLKALHDHLPTMLGNMGFPLLQYPDGANPHIHDAHRYLMGTRLMATSTQRWCGMCTTLPELSNRCLVRWKRCEASLRS